MKLGLGEKAEVTYSTWPAYTWKNELSARLHQVKRHFSEVLDDEFKGEHDPFHMLDRAIVLAAFTIRRMSEKRLITDNLRERAFPVRSFPAVNGDEFRKPYIGATGGHFFDNYEYSEEVIEQLHVNDIANEVIHAYQLAVVKGAQSFEDGLLIASDRRQTFRILHLTIDEFSAIAEAVLEDQVVAASDSWDPETNSVTATRD